jgi:catechol 2,3-dioxygenase-like lactoylglutathione lyase family enzyme
MFDHISLQVNDVAASRDLYAAVLAPLGILPGHDDGTTVGFFGSDSVSFWLAPAERSEDRELHLAFSAGDRATVDAFHAAALAFGAEVLHAPRIFPEYHEHYYGAFIRDLDGHNIEAVCHQSEL